MILLFTHTFNGNDNVSLRQSSIRIMKLGIAAGSVSDAKGCVWWRK